jgi:hypothetical protein
MRYDISLDRLKELLHYDPETGLFKWLDDRNCGVKFEIAGSLSNQGYAVIHIEGYTYLSHRVAVFYMTGKWPELDIDHINGIRNDNRFVNLREVDRKTNIRNRKGPNKNGSTGLLGVSKCKSKFRSQIIVNGERIHLGVFPTPEKAHKVYLKAKVRYHPGACV